MEFPNRRRGVVSEKMAGEAVRVTADRFEHRSTKTAFRVGDDVVYAAHGPGRVVEIGIENIAGHRFETIKVSFPKDRMTLRLPSASASASGLRHVVSSEQLDDIFSILKGRPRRAMVPWIRRSQELQAQLATGDLFRLARILRDLRRFASTDEGSFSERKIYEIALERVAAEMQVSMKLDQDAVIAALVTTMTSANLAACADEPAARNVATA